MGWCKGTEIACDLWDIVKEYIPSKEKKQIATKVYDLFCDNDADCWEGGSDLESDAEIKYEEDE